MIEHLKLKLDQPYGRNHKLAQQEFDIPLTKNIDFNKDEG